MIEKSVDEIFRELVAEKENQSLGLKGLRSQPKGVKGYLRVLKDQIDGTEYENFWVSIGFPDRREK